MPHPFAMSHALDLDCFVPQPFHSADRSVGVGWATDPHWTTSCVIGAHEKTSWMLVGGPVTVSRRIEETIATRFAARASVHVVQHSPEAIAVLGQGGIDGVVVFDDLAGHAVLRAIVDRDLPVASVCIIEHCAAEDRPATRAHLRREGALACLVAAELEAPALEAAMLHALELHRTVRTIVTSPRGSATPEPCDATTFVEALQRALARRRVDAGFRTHLAYIDARHLHDLAPLEPQALQALRETLEARLMEAAPSARVGRLEGSAYGCLVTGTADEVADLDTLQRIYETARRAFELDGESMSFDTPVSIVHASRNEDAVSLLERAIRAARLEQPLSFDPAELSGVRLRIEPETEPHAHALQRAMEAGDLSMCFQPIVRLSTGKPVAFEALMRWNDNGETRAAAEFIGIAERSNLLLPLSYWALETSFRQVATWMQSGLLAPGMRININLSQAQIADPRLPVRIRSLLLTTGAEPEHIRFEVEAAHVATHRDQARRLIDGLVGQGFGLWIEDFGAGACTVDDLRQLPIEALKIDRSFVAGLDGSSVTIGRARHVADAARALRVEVVGEGIENPLQANVLRALGCEVGQGFLYSRPKPVSDLQTYLQRGAYPLIP